MDIEEHFKIPIQYDKDMKEVDKVMLVELNLVENSSIDICNGIYEEIFDLQTVEEKNIMNQIVKYYTSNKKFIKDIQVFHNTFDISNIETNHTKIENWDKFKNQEEFLKKYQYLEFEKFSELNKNPIFLQAMTLYNLTSPLLQLLVPFIFLLLPFFIMKFSMKVPISLEMYKSILLKQLSGHSLGRVLGQLTSPENIEKKLTASFTVAFYLFSMYQNALLCYRFYKNIFRIKQYIEELTEELKLYSNRMILLKQHIENKSLGFNNNFISTLERNREKLDNLIEELEQGYKFEFSIRTIIKVGELMRVFYKLYHDEEVNALMCYIQGLNGYIMVSNKLKKFVNDSILQPCKLGNNTILSSVKYPNKDNSYIENDYNNKKGYIITGPNAAGKTTYIKSILLNILLSQQIGFGFYNDSTINPYDVIYSYINIPDTCGRDSLFQAEAKRCLEIIEEIEENGENREKHYLCIFDELFSGTNPEEATIAGKAVLKYMGKHNVDVLMTTHYYGICDLAKTSKYKNYHLGTREKYKIQTGRSKEKGGIKVLKDLGYPVSILESLEKSK